MIASDSAAPGCMGRRARSGCVTGVGRGFPVPVGGRLPERPVVIAVQSATHCDAITAGLGDSR
jgi:hypothetical protein